VVLTVDCSKIGLLSRDMSDDAGSGSPAEKTGEKAQDGAAKKAPPPQKKKKGKGKW
jgi:hypothetical protein